MFETIMGWIGYTPTSKYQIVLAQLASANETISHLYFATMIYQVSLIALVCWGVYRGYKLILDKKEKSTKADKKIEKEPEDKGKTE